MDVNKLMFVLLVVLTVSYVAGWLPLLSQTQAGIEAVEAAMKESLTP